MIAAETSFGGLLESLRGASPSLPRASARELRAVLRGLPRVLDRTLLRLRYLEGYTVPETVEALAEMGICYSQRHVERLLRRAEKEASAVYLARAWEQKRRKHETGPTA